MELQGFEARVPMGIPRDDSVQGLFHIAGIIATVMQTPAELASDSDTLTACAEEVSSDVRLRLRVLYL